MYASVKPLQFNFLRKARPTGRALARGLSALPCVSLDAVSKGPIYGASRNHPLKGRNMLDKKDARKARDDFALHVLLLQREGLSKSVALFTAWSEGPAGLDRRLGQQSLIPLLDPQAASAALTAKPKAA